MNGPQIPADRPARHRSSRAVGETESHTDRVYRECELCETTRQLQESYGMYVCAECEETYLP
ncbi:hypothetical protein ACFQMA_09470 [Halosimplex aquaticum]|uniref:Small CPxCG-related zinc finger protein n=1 Tax=Halosimplex aquaticum TaxID=3026162 RepID=A0ABD5Y1F6_9EURY|nr:hypothetical protein [Halosimplex aquaticum]